MTARESFGQVLEFVRSTAARSAPVGVKLRAMVRFGWRQVHKRVFRRPMVIDWEGMRLVVPLNAASAGAAYYFGRQDVWEFAFLERLLRPGDVVADIGANVGIYTMFLARLVGRAGEVIACEPDPSSLEALRENLRTNELTQVRIQPVVVGDSDGVVRFHIGLDTVGRISHTAEGTELPMRSLDNLCVDRSPVFFKVDVEGGEQEVMRGARQLMKRGCPLVWQIEIPAEPKDDEPLCALLQDYGYIFAVYDTDTQRVHVGPYSSFKGQNNVLALLNHPQLHERLGDGAQELKQSE